MTWKKITSFDIYDQHTSGDHKDCYPGTQGYWNSCSERLQQLKQQHASGNHEECKYVPTLSGTTWDACRYKYIRNLHDLKEHSWCDENSCESKIPQMHERDIHTLCTANSCQVKLNEERHTLGDHRLCIPYESNYDGEGWLNCSYKAQIYERKHKNGNHESCLPGGSANQWDWNKCIIKRKMLYHDQDNHIYCNNCDVQQEKTERAHKSGDHQYCVNFHACKFKAWQEWFSLDPEDES